MQEYYQDTKEVAPESKVISKATLLLEKKWIPFEKYIRKIDLDMLEKDSHHDVVKGAISSLRNAVEAQKVPDDIVAQLGMLDRLLSCSKHLQLAPHSCGPLNVVSILIAVGRQSLIDSLHNEDDTHTPRRRYCYGRCVQARIGGLDVSRRTRRLDSLISCQIRCVLHKRCRHVNSS